MLGNSEEVQHSSLYPSQLYMGRGSEDWRTEAGVEEITKEIGKKRNVGVAEA